MLTIITKKAGGIVFNEEGKILVVLRNKIGDLTLPKGHLENDESFEDCAIREVEEETGYKCIIKSFVGILEYDYIKNDNKILSQIHFYEMKPVSYDRKNIIENEIKEVLWISLEGESIEQLTHQSDKHFIMTHYHGKNIFPHSRRDEL